MIMVLTFLLLLGMTGCSKLSAVELVDCRNKVNEMHAMKHRLVEIMNRELEGTAAHELAYLQYRALSMNMSIYHRDPSKIACWGTEP